MFCCHWDKFKSIDSKGGWSRGCSFSCYSGTSSKEVFQLCLRAALLSHVSMEKQHIIRSSSPHVHLMNVHQLSTWTFMFREQKQIKWICFVFPLTVQFLITVCRPGFRYQSTVFLPIGFSRSYTIKKKNHFSFSS